MGLICISDSIRSTAVMSTNAVSFLLLYIYRDGATLGEFASALDILRSELRAASRDTGFTGDSLDVLNHAVSILISTGFIVITLSWPFTFT